MSLRPGSKTRERVKVIEQGQLLTRTDYLAGEEPLEIRLNVQQEQRTLAVTMRTPGADFELAAGFLYSEGVITSRDDIHRITYCVDRTVDEEQRYNIVNVQLRQNYLPDLPHLERHFFTSSACGVCGKASLEALHLRGCSLIPTGLQVGVEILHCLPEQLRSGQSLFGTTGGLHAAALFTAAGQSMAVREDVGRHNALDKLIGWALLEGLLPLQNHLVLVSGRASFEIMQKCLMAGVPIVCAISAPSNLAVAVAQSFGQTLIGFLRKERFNIYSGVERVRLKGQ